MKQTLLELCQDISSSMGSDEFNSIGDTTESLQIANCVKQAYFNMVAKYDLPEHNQLFQLDSAADQTKPVLMTRPQGISRIEWIKYFDSNPSDSTGIQTGQYGAYSHDLNLDITSSSNWATTSTSLIPVQLGTAVFSVPSNLVIGIGDGAKATSGINEMVGNVVSYVGTTLTLNITKISGSGTYAAWNIAKDLGTFGPGYLDVSIVSLEYFLELTNHLNLSDPHVQSMQLTFNNVSSNVAQTFTFNFRTDIHPKYCCTLSNQHVIFDSYDSTQDSTLQASKSLCYGWVTPSWTATDAFIPNLDENMFPMLLNEAKALAFFELKQQPHQKAEQEIQRQRGSLQKFKNIAERPSYFDAFANFGRRGGGTGR